MRASIVLGIARAEARLTRRLVRYWVFVALSALAGLVGYLYYAFLHAFFSSYSATVSAITPRYLVQAVGANYLLLFVVGLIFLAFDVRGRDERERVVEVLDSRPCSNLELVVGRFLGLLVPAWVPVVGVALAIQLIGWSARAFELRIGEPVEPGSLVAFVVLMAIPAFTLVIGVVYFLALAVRNRLVTAVVSLALVGGLVTFMLLKVPLDLLPLADLTGAYSISFPSDLVSELLALRGVLQRLAVLLAGAGLLTLAAVIHPRPDGGGRRRWAAGGVALLALAGLALASLGAQAYADRSTRAAWKAAHEALRHEPAPDLQALRGTASVIPGQTLAVDLEMRFAAPAEVGLEHAVFTLNPRLEVLEVAGPGDAELAHTHRDGLLDVELAEPLAPGAETTIHLRYRGRPDSRFAYLDSALELSRQTLLNANLVLLGYQAAIFDRGYVALMPGVRWLPTAGADVGREDPDRPVDFFDLDLAVELPAGWLAAGPGRRQEDTGATAGRVRYRFAPPAPLPEAALVASRFTRRAFTAKGVELELLLHPTHTRNLAVFDEAGGEIRRWITEHLEEAADLGLAYPYDALTVVEVPTSLRGFGGGWRMDTTLAPPAMLLLRESSFPTARFDSRFRRRESFEDREGGIERAKLEVLERFFAADFNGGNLFRGAARNVFLYQTAARGSGARALDFVLHDLTTRLATGQEGYFSAYMFSSELNQVIGRIIAGYLSQRGRITLAEAVLTAVTDRPEVWEQALDVSLAALDPWQNPGRAVNVLFLKGNAMARSLLDGLGRRPTAELLAALRARAAGRTFTRSELVAVAGEQGIDLDQLLADWLDQTALPGFVAAEPRRLRLADAADGTPRYQVTLALRNDEPVAGLARLRYSFDKDGPSWEEGAPFRVPAEAAVEVGLTLPQPPERLEVAPYLSRNRGPFAVALPSFDAEKVVAGEPWTGVRPSDWAPATGGAIVIDDLDPGFAVALQEDRSGLRLGARARQRQEDQGLPRAESFEVPAEWSRATASEAWGKYRHTLAVVRAGEGQRAVRFTAELPHAGAWRLALYLPSAKSLSRRWQRGTYHLTVIDGAGDRQEVSFDAGAAEEGWNELQELEMPAGQAVVELSDRSDGAVVLADAVRWSPAAGGAAREEEHGEE